MLYLECKDKVCASDSTCGYLGACVPATVNLDECASEAGCGVEGDPRLDVPIVADRSVWREYLSYSNTGSTDPAIACNFYVGRPKCEN